MNPTKKSPKFQERKGHAEYLVDRISDLTDPILARILSFIPTKYAVATSVLSKRWKSLWTEVTNLDFSRNGNTDMEFVQFVNRVLLHHNAPSIHRFRLAWKDYCIPSHVNSWISTAIAKNVCQLVLRIGRKCKIPTSIFSCETLQSLKLKGIMYIPASIVVSLPKLETLKIVSVYFKSDEAFQKIISGCPMLNYLHLHVVLEIQLIHFGRDYRPLYRYIISSTSLRRLELGVDCLGQPIPCEVELEASSLEYLKLEGFISKMSVLGSLSSLVEADCRIQWSDDSDFIEDDFDSLVQVVRAFHCAESLTLATHAMWALSNATVRLSTKFSRLKRLMVGVDYLCCSSLKDFLQSSDTLEVLTIYKDPIDRYLSDLSLEDYYGHDNWIAPQEVPRCLSNSLKEVEFDGYTGSDDEPEMIGYMLMHGSALEVVQIYFHSDTEKKGIQSRLVQEISNFPRKSTACEVEFSTSCSCDPMANEMIMHGV